MRSLLLTLLGCLIIVFSQAHEGELLKIDNVTTDAHCNHVYFHFDIENVEEILLKDIRIDLIANGRSLNSIKVDRFNPNQSIEATIPVSAGLLQGVPIHAISIQVTRIFDVPKDWGGWHGVDPSVANYNDIGDFEIYADAPWRMTVYDDNDVAQDIPLHLLCHDGNEFFDESRKPFLEYVDVYLKKASEASFGDRLTFADMSSEEFDALFSARSPERIDISIKSFDSSSPISDAGHTIAFRELYNETADFFYTNLKEAWWYTTLNIPAAMLEVYADDDVLDIKVEFSLRDISGEPYKRESYLRIFRNGEGMPSIVDYHRGDTHVHTIFSQSVIEFGGPLEATKEAAKAIGIDWIIATDHSSDFDNWRGRSIPDAWDRLGEEVDRLNATDPSLPFIRGIEMSLNNGQDELIHFLAYPGFEDPVNLPYLGDGRGDAQLTNVTAVRTLERLEEIDGFAYAAHPFANEDELPDVGGLWNVGDGDFKTNGTPWNSQGLVQCNKAAAPSDIFSPRSNEIIFNPLKGAQIWGERYSLTAETDPYDPYAISEDHVKQLADASDNERFYLTRYRQGEEVVNFVNQKALRLKNADESLDNFKFFFSAGTDAHGSFNYSNTYGFGIWLTDEDVETNNLAFGNLSCVAYTPDGPGDQGQHALKAMHDGMFSLSDGPILVQSVSTDGNDADNELFMGMDAEVEEAEIDDVVINLDYVSTEEFGTLDYMKVFVGTEDGETSFEVTGIGSLTANVSLDLEDIFGRAGFLTVLKDQYFYIRAEVRTHKEYGEDSPKIIERENFHAFTNPIWLRVNSTITSVSEELLNSFRIYPNPASDVFRIEAAQAADAVEIFDATGKMVVKRKLRRNGVNVSNLPAGNYSVVVIYGDDRIVRKLIIP